jgi:hypothetical protein
MFNISFEILVFLLVLLLWIVSTFGPGIYMLRPLDRAARLKLAVVQFTLVDFLALTAHLSIPLGLVGPLSSSRIGDRGFQIVLVFFGCFAAFLIWWGTVRTAARAGIHQPLKRLLMIGFVVPIAFVSAIAFGIVFPMLLWTPFYDPTDPHPSGFLLLAISIGLIAVFVVCRRLVDWILRPDIEVVDESVEKRAIPD